MAEGIVDSAKRVVAHFRSLAELEKELARYELQQKGATFAAGAGLVVAAILFLPFAIGFGLAAIAAALALVVDWWLALVIVFVALVLLLVLLVMVARTLFKRATPMKPEQAIAEFELTKQALRSSRAG